MFIKKKCTKCGRKISKDYDFCPHCGNDFRWEKARNNEKDFGLLGKEDSLTDFSDLSKFGMPMNLSGLFNSKLFNNLFQQFDKQFKELDKETSRAPKERKKNTSGISISISMSGDKPDIRVNKFGPEFQNINIKEFKEKETPKKKISEEEARKLAKLPKKEAKTEVRRLSNKIIYQIDLPGIKNLKDIIINKLENSIEIKAFSKENAYFKLIPVNLPILDYKLEDNKLILELGTR